VIASLLNFFRMGELKQQQLEDLLKGKVVVVASVKLITPLVVWTKRKGKSHCKYQGHRDNEYLTDCILYPARNIF
jgi:hypothetical protein